MWALAACAGIVVWLAGGVVLGDDDPSVTDGGAPGSSEAESATDGPTTTRRDTTTRPEPTTTTDVIPGAPLLGEPSGLQLVITYYHGFGSNRLIDLDTGEITHLDARVLAVTERRLIVTADGTTVALWPAPYDGSGATRIATIPAGRVVHEAWMVGDGTLVWLFQGLPERGAPGFPYTADLVDLEGRTLAHLDIRDDLWAAGAVDRGLVVSGPGGIYVIDPQGAAERISTGDLVALAHNRVHAYTCDERLQCGIEVLDEWGQRLDWSPNTGVHAGEGIAAPDGRVALQGQANQITVDGVPVFQAAAAAPTGYPAWSPDGRWLAVPTGDEIHFVDTHSDTAPIALEIGPAQDLIIFSSK
ncbi:MAG: hypothetical protein ABWZ52_09705 [Acidimicrobiales bacterium]